MYARINPDRKTLTPAPRSYGATCNPSAATHLAHGFKPVTDAPPPAEEGHYVRPTGYDEDATTIWRTYEQVPLPPPPPRRWSRLAIKTALAQAGMLAAARQFLAAVEIATSYTAWEALTDCDYVEEGYPDAEKWDALLDGAATALGKTRAEIDAFLDNIPQEGGV